MNTINELKAQLRAAAERSRKLRDEWDSALERVRTIHEPGCLEARNEVDRLEAAIRQAESDAVQAHPWEGEKVQATVEKFVSRHSPRRHLVTLTGIVETRTLKSAPLRGAYGQPQIGETFIRYTKRDGTGGAGYERLTRNSKWRKVSDPHGPALEVPKTEPLIV